MDQGLAYLDHNATTPLRPEARAALLAALAEPGNPSSVHGWGRRARARVEEARAAVAALAGCEPAEVVFTSGGTEANNLGMMLPAASLVVSAIEHDSVLAPARARSAAEGLPLLLVTATAAGLIDLEALETALDAAPQPALMSLMLANNETGAVQPVAEAAAMVRQRGGFVFCDAVQAAGKIPLDFAALGIHAMSLSAHKIGGPTGVGALILRGDIALDAVQKGGGQELGRRAGTENLAGIAAFGAAAAAARRDLPGMAALGALRDDLERRIRAEAPEAVIHAAAAPRLPNTSCVGLPKVSAELQVMALDLAGVAVSAGAACSSGKVRPSHVLTAMGLDPAEARNAIRFSFGWTSTAAEMEQALAAWLAFRKRKRGGA